MCNATFADAFAAIMAHVRPDMTDAELDALVDVHMPAPVLTAIEARARDVRDRRLIPAFMPQPDILDL